MYGTIHTHLSEKKHNMKTHCIRLGMVFAGLSTIGYSATVTFNTFVNGGAIAGVEGGQQNTIGFTYAGDKFVGTVYTGPNNLQLYSTDLNGGSVQLFGNPLPT